MNYWLKTIALVLTGMGANALYQAGMRGSALYAAIMVLMMATQTLIDGVETKGDHPEMIRRIPGNMVGGLVLVAVAWFTTR